MSVCMYVCVYVCMYDSSKRPHPVQLQSGGLCDLSGRPPSKEERTTRVPYPVVLQLHNPEPETVPTLDSELDDSTPCNALNRYETAQKTLIDHIYKHVKPTIV